MKHRFCLFLPLTLFVTVPNDTFARDWLQPLPSKGKEPFVLEEFRFVPYRFMYKGFSAENSNIRYLLKTEDGRLFSLHLGETIDGEVFCDIGINAVPFRNNRCAWINKRTSRRCCTKGVCIFCNKRRVKNRIFGNFKSRNGRTKALPVIRPKYKRAVRQHSAPLAKITFSFAHKRHKRKVC